MPTVGADRLYHFSDRFDTNAAGVVHVDSRVGLPGHTDWL